MEKTIKDFFLQFKPLDAQDKEILQHAKEYFKEENINELSQLLRQKKMKCSLVPFTLSNQVFEHTAPFPTFEATTNDPDIISYIAEANQTLQTKLFKNIYPRFAANAWKVFPKLIAPNIIGHDIIKKAVALQLFAVEPIHILLLGDPAIGKTDIIRSASELHPIATYGLGSGMSGVGLAVTLIGDEVEPGLLPLADQGICCLDELNLLKEESRGSLYNAMEKGFITYDKKGKHLRFDARVRVLATANPLGDKFTGKTIAELKKQIPFDDALLSRFHLTFLTRKPDTAQFLQITDAILKQKKVELTKTDISFLKSYICHAEQLTVTLPEVYHQDIVTFVSELKKKEGKALFEISPRLVIGIVRLAQARARLSLRTKVIQEDIEEIKKIVERAMEIV